MTTPSPAAEDATATARVSTWTGEGRERREERDNCPSATCHHPGLTDNIEGMGGDGDGWIWRRRL